MDYVIGLGANLGSRRANVETAIALLDAIGRVTGVSRLYESAPIGPPQPHYLNAAVRVESQLTAPDLLAALLALEALLGRERSPGLRWGPRPIDLDILWSQAPFASATLSIPHARLLERWFALAPLLEVAPELEPEYGAALRQLEGACPRYGEQLTAATRTVERELGGAVQLDAASLDPADAVADALAALGTRLGASDACGTSAAQVVLLQADASAAGLATLVRAALDQAARGFGWSYATVNAWEHGHVAARLLGASAPAGATVPVLLDAELTRDGDMHRASIRLTH